MPTASYIQCNHKNPGLVQWFYPHCSEIRSEQSLLFTLSLSVCVSAEKILRGNRMTSFSCKDKNRSTPRAAHTPKSVSTYTGHNSEPWTFHSRVPIPVFNLHVILGSLKMRNFIFKGVKAYFCCCRR